MADMLPETKSSIGASTGWDDLMPNNAVIHMDVDPYWDHMGMVMPRMIKGCASLIVPASELGPILALWIMSWPFLAHLCVWSQRSLFALRCPERFWNIWSFGQPTLLEPGWFGSERSNPSSWNKLPLAIEVIWGCSGMVKLFLDEHPFTEFTGYSWLFYGVYLYICLPGYQADP